MINIDSVVPVVDQKVDIKNHLNLTNTLQVLVDQIDGSILIDKNGQLITISVDQVDAIEKSYF